MTRHTMAIDLDSCIGCHSCAVVCKQENNVGLGTFYSKVLTVGPSGTYPDLEMYYLPVACQHCENPQCVSVCPTGASYKRDDGIVLVDHSKCVGCQYCVMACPYGVRTYGDVKTFREADGFKLAGGNGTVITVKPKGFLVDDGKEPACVRHCPGQARVFGDADDPESKVSKLVAAKKTHKLTDVGNKPSVTFGLDKCEWKGGE